jgi:hypothetical protein
VLQHHFLVDCQRDLILLPTHAGTFQAQTQRSGERSHGPGVESDQAGFAQSEATAVRPQIRRLQIEFLADQPVMDAESPDPSAAWIEARQTT